MRTPNLAAMLSGMAAAPRRPGPIDDTSKRIIEQLQADGRRPYGEIGKAVGLSEAAVRQRVQKLTETGVMQIVAVTDPMQLGFHRQAMIGIRVSGDARRVAEAVAEIEAIDYVVITVGAFDVLAEVVCEDDEDLLSLINDVIRPIDGVLGHRVTAQRTGALRADGLGGVLVRADRRGSGDPDEARVEVLVPAAGVADALAQRRAVGIPSCHDS